MENADLKEVLKRLGDKGKFPFDERKRELPHASEEEKHPWIRTASKHVVEST